MESPDTLNAPALTFHSISHKRLVMKITNRAAVVALPILLLSSVFANAATDRDAVQACSDAIASIVEKKQGAAVNLRVDDSGINPREKLVSRRTSFEMNALDATEENVIGRFRCQVDRKAYVTQLRTLTLDLPVAEHQNRS